LQPLIRERGDIETHVIADADHTIAVNPHETMPSDKTGLLAAHPESPTYFFILGDSPDQHAPTR
jgi:hypothetical protein